MARKLIEFFTCDHCGAEMSKCSNRISWNHSIDRDVEESITVNISGSLSYARDHLHICKDCAIKILKAAITKIELT